MQQKQSLNEVENLYFRHYHSKRLESNSNSNASQPSSSSSAAEPPSAPSSQSTAPTEPETTPNITTKIPVEGSAQPEVESMEDAPVGEENAEENAEGQKSSAYDLFIAHHLYFDNSLVSQPPEIPPSPRKPSATPSPPTEAQPHTPNHPPNSTTDEPQAISFLSTTTTPPGHPSTPRANPYPYHFAHLAHNPGHSAHSSAAYLSNAYVSSSPFPVNMPPPGSGSPAAFGAHNQALTYDSFWSAHSSWSMPPADGAPSAAHSPAKSAVSRAS